MFKLVRDDKGRNENPSTFQDQTTLSFIFSLISPRFTTNYFAVRLHSSNNVSVSLSAFIRRPVLVELNFYNHKGSTYARLNQTEIPHCVPLHSYNLQRRLVKEWIPNLSLPEVAIFVKPPSGQLHSSAFVQLEFTNVSVGTDRVLIQARTTSAHCCRTLLIMVDLLYNVPQLYCYDAGYQESDRAVV
jgi:hypothetical protein